MNEGETKYSIYVMLGQLDRPGDEIHNIRKIPNKFWPTSKYSHTKSFSQHIRRDLLCL